MPNHDQLKALENILIGADLHIGAQKAVVDLAELRAMYEAWSAERNASSGGGWRPTHRHVKRGTLYKLVSSAILQTADLIGDNAFLALYQAADGLYWVRPADEFNDGRFEALPPHPDASSQNEGVGQDPEAKGGGA